MSRFALAAAATIGFLAGSSRPSFAPSVREGRGTTRPLSRSRRSSLVHHFSRANGRYWDIDANNGYPRSSPARLKKPRQWR